MNLPIILSLILLGINTNLANSNAGRKSTQGDEEEVLDFPDYQASQHDIHNDRPLIGILSQPSSWPKVYHPDNFSYVATSYVRYLEAAGARVVPIRYDLPLENISNILNSINGLFLPGGGTEFFHDNHNKEKISGSNASVGEGNLTLNSTAHGNNTANSANAGSLKMNFKEKASISQKIKKLYKEVLESPLNMLHTNLSLVNNKSGEAQIFSSPETESTTTVRLNQSLKIVNINNLSPNMSSTSGLKLENKDSKDEDSSSPQANPFNTDVPRVVPSAPTADSHGQWISDEEEMEPEKGELTEFAIRGSEILQLAIEKNKNGTYFPVWGTCLGFELMLLGISDKKRILGNFNSTNHSMRLKFMNTSLESKLFARMPERMKLFLQHEKSLYFNHKYGIDFKTFSSSPKVSSFFEPLTINHDKSGNVFISTIEGKELPFYGVQYHPEKNPFEWKDHLEINHQSGAIEISHYFANFFVNEARKNNQKFNSSKEEKRELMLNYYPIQLSESFNSVYIFSKPGSKDPFRVSYKKLRSNSTANNTNNSSLNGSFTDNNNSNASLAGGSREKEGIKKVYENLNYAETSDLKKETELIDQTRANDEIPRFSEVRESLENNDINELKKEYQLSNDDGKVLSYLLLKGNKVLSTLVDLVQKRKLSGEREIMTG